MRQTVERRITARSVVTSSPYPAAADPDRVGTYPARVSSGGGFVWDAVLEYRVWRAGGEAAGGSADDEFAAFATYDEAATCARETPGADAPLALVLQEEYLDEPAPGRYVHVREPRITEWPVELLTRPRRTARTIPDFLAPDAPPNRLDILRGISQGSPRAGD